MAQTLGELVLKLQLDQAQFKTQLAQIENNTKQTSKTFDKMGLALKALPIAAVAAALYKFGQSIAKAASDGQEAQQKFNVVFSGIQTKANKMADSLAASFALSNVEVKNMLANTGNILQGFGFAGTASLDLSAKITSLSADLISFTNNSMGVSGATDAITKAMLGEREQMKSLGIAILDADLIKIARDQGKNYEAMTKQDKALLTFNQILKLSGNAVGDFARSFDSPANTLRAVTSRMTDLQEKAGRGITPALAGLGRAFLLATKDGGVLTKGIEIIVKGLSTLVIGIARFVLYMEEVNKKGEVRKTTKELEEQNDSILELDQTYNTYFNHLRRGNESNVEIARRVIKENKASASSIAIAERAVSDYREANEALQHSQVGVQRSGDSLNATRKASQKIIDDMNAALVENNINSGKEKQSQKENISLLDIKIAKMRDERDAIQTYSQLMSKATAATFENYSQISKFQKINDMVQAAGSAMTGLFAAIQGLQQATMDAALEALEAEHQAILRSAGLAEETALETAQKEYDIAVKSGNQETIIEKKKALEKTKIDEAYEKKKAQLEYQAKVQAWEWQMATTVAQVAMGIAAAVAAGGSYLQGAIVMIPLLTAMAAATGAIQIAAVAASKPKPPSFETGGIVPGNMTTGDNVVARVNSKEMILNQQQQANLFDIAQGGSQGQMIHAVFNIDGTVLCDYMTRASFNKRTLTFSGAVVN